MENILAQQPVMYKDITDNTMTETEKILVVLETDALLARQLNHPQGDMIQEE